MGKIEKNIIFLNKYIMFNIRMIKSSDELSEKQ